MQPELGAAVQRLADERAARSAAKKLQDIPGRIRPPEGPLELLATGPGPMSRSDADSWRIISRSRRGGAGVIADGNGPISAFVHGMRRLGHRRSRGRLPRAGPGKGAEPTPWPMCPSSSRATACLRRRQRHQHRPGRHAGNRRRPEPAGRAVIGEECLQKKRGKAAVESPLCGLY